MRRCIIDQNFLAVEWTTSASKSKSTSINKKWREKYKYSWNLWQWLIHYVHVDCELRRKENRRRGEEMGEIWRIIITISIHLYSTRSIQLLPFLFFVSPLDFHFQNSFALESSICKFHLKWFYHCSQFTCLLLTGIHIGIFMMVWGRYLYQCSLYVEHSVIFFSFHMKKDSIICKKFCRKKKHLW